MMIDANRARDLLGYPRTNPLRELEQAFERWLLLRDKNVVRVAVATVAANQLPGDPLWLFLVGASSGVKSELIVSLSGLKAVFPLSNLTSNTLVSGMKTKGADPSLLPRLPYGCTLALKDFSTILSLGRDTRAEIVAQLREVYDGSFTKGWGTGKILKWKGKVGFLAGTTGIIDHHYAVYAVLGERFLQYRIEQPDPEEVARVAMANQGKETAMRSELAGAVEEFFGTLDLTELPEITQDTIERLAALSAFCVVARSGVVRDQFGNKDILLVPEPEAPPRFAKQLALLIKALMVCGSTESEAYQLAVKVGFDSIHATRFAVIKHLVREPGELATSTIAAGTGYPTNTVRRYLEDLAALGVVNVTKQGSGKPDLWSPAEIGLRRLEKAVATGFAGGVPHV